MLAVTSSAVRDNFKEYCNRVVNDDETIIIARKDEKNVVMISADAYDAMTKAVQNAEYFFALNKSMRQMQEGRIVTKTMEELEELADE